MRWFVIAAVLVAACKESGKAERILSVAFSADGKLLVAGGNGEIQSVAGES